MASRRCSVEIGEESGSDGYPVVTRCEKTSILLRISREVPRFGTEGSVVQIHSPRPKFDSTTDEFLRKSCCLFLAAPIFVKAAGPLGF